MGRKKRQVDLEYRFIPSSLRSSFKEGVYCERHLWVVSELTIPLYMETASEHRSHGGADGYKRLYSKILKGVLGNGYKAFFEQLVNDLIIEAQLSDEGRESYSTKDNLSKRYRLTTRYREEVMAGWPIQLPHNRLETSPSPRRFLFKERQEGHGRSPMGGIGDACNTALALR